MHKRLSHIPTWLIVFDNADDYGAVEKFIPRELGDDQHILITSRSGSHWPSIKHYPLSEFSAAESIAYIHRILPNEVQEKASSLATELNFLPLAISHAVAYIQQEKSTIEIFLANFKATSSSSSKGRGGGGKNNKVNPTLEQIGKTWSISMEKIEKRSPDAANMLNMCAFLAPDNIPLELLVPILDNMLQSVHQAVVVLRDYSMVQTSKLPDNIQVHRLLQSTIVDHNVHSEISVKSLFEKLNTLADAMMTYYPKEKLTVADCERPLLMLPHLVALSNFLLSLITSADADAAAAADDESLRKKYGVPSEIFVEDMDAMLQSIADQEMVRICNSNVFDDVYDYVDKTLSAFANAKNNDKPFSDFFQNLSHEQLHVLATQDLLLIPRWFKLDTHTVSSSSSPPTRYVLQPIHTLLPEYRSDDKDEHTQASNRLVDVIFPEIQRILKKASQSLPQERQARVVSVEEEHVPPTTSPALSSTTTPTTLQNNHTHATEKHTLVKILNMLQDAHGFLGNYAQQQDRKSVV